MASELAAIFPGMGQAASDPFGTTKAPGAGFARGVLGILGNRIAQEKQYAALLGQSQAQAQAQRSKSLMDAILAQRQIEASVVSPSLKRMSDVEREERIRELTPWAPRTQEDWLWALQQRRKYGAPRGGGGGAKGLEDLSLRDLQLIRNRIPDEPAQAGFGLWGGGQQAAPDPWKLYRDRVDTEIQRRIVTEIPQEGGGTIYP